MGTKASFRGGWSRDRWSSCDPVLPLDRPEGAATFWVRSDAPALTGVLRPERQEIGRSGYRSADWRARRPAAHQSEQDPSGLGIPLGIQPWLLESTRVNGGRSEVGQSFAIAGVSTMSVHLLIRWSPVRTLPASEHAGTAHGERPPIFFTCDGNSQDARRSATSSEDGDSD
jgi:hypothetical protein